MKQFNVLINALQDIIAETFETEEKSNLHLPAIREMAQKALSKYNTSIPKPELKCPSDFVIGQDYYRFTECTSCPRKYAQICSVYNYVWYKCTDKSD